MEKVVVLIDDDPDDIELLRESIRTVSPELQCIHFDHSVEAVKKMSSKDFPVSPDYIFIDFNMPIMNGEECLRELKGVKGLSKAKFILNSTSMPNHLADRLKSEGADVTFQKPYQ